MVKHKGSLIYRCNKCSNKNMKDHYHFSGSKIYEDHYDHRDSQPWERMYE